MALPAKIQASVLSWVGESSAAPSEPAAAGDDAASTERYQYPLLTPADLFSLSSEGLAAGSPGVVVKDGFLGREQASRAYNGERFLLLGLRRKPIMIVFRLCLWAQHAGQKKNWLSDSQRRRCREGLCEQAGVVVLGWLLVFQCSHGLYCSLCLVAVSSGLRRVQAMAIIVSFSQPPPPPQV